MNKLSILHKIPAYFRNNPYLSKITELTSASSVRYSALLINQNNQNYLLLKEGNIYVREDWEAFSILRASSKLLIASGQNLRKEHDIFKSREGYGNQNIQDLNQALIGKQKQKVFVFTRSLSEQKLKSYVNDQLYDLIQLPHYESVHNALQMLIKQQNLPMSVEVGIELLSQYFKSVDKGSKNRIDTLLISKFSGSNLQPFKGSKFTIPFEKYYDVKWKSDAYPCKLSNGLEGKLTFEVHVSK